ncbi:MAG: hypothetical protein WCO52_02320 [bacterium]
MVTVNKKGFPQGLVGFASGAGVSYYTSGVDPYTVFFLVGTGFIILAYPLAHWASQKGKIKLV